MAKLSPKQRRKFRIRNSVKGTAERTLAAASTLSPDLKGTLENDNKTAAAKKVGALIAKMCAEKQVQKVVFDRNGNLYHGRVKALAEAAREAGLQF
jgi:large subunit ribosomal protein L18